MSHPTFSSRPGIWPSPFLPSNSLAGRTCTASPANAISSCTILPAAHNPGLSEASGNRPKAPQMKISLPGSHDNGIPPGCLCRAGQRRIFVRGQGSASGTRRVVTISSMSLPWRSSRLLSTISSYEDWLWTAVAAGGGTAISRGASSPVYRRKRKGTRASSASSCMDRVLDTNTFKGSSMPGSTMRALR